MSLTPSMTPKLQLLEMLDHAQERIAELEAEKKQKDGCIADLKRQLTELEAKLAEAERIVADAPELNLSNYDHDQVCRLNNAMNEVWQLLWADEAIDAAREESDG